MKKLLIALLSLLFVVGFISMVWAHGLKGSGSGFRSHGHSKFHFSKSSHSRIGGGFRQHHGKFGRGSSVRSRRHSKFHFNRSFHSRKHFRYNRHFRNHRYYSPYFSPFVRYYDYDDNPPREEVLQIPQHTPSSRIYYNDNPEPWFLYGKGKEFRQMGLIPSLPQASQELK
jgi:hypothetical protein